MNRVLCSGIIMLFCIACTQNTAIKNKASENQTAQVSEPKQQNEIDQTISSEKKAPSESVSYFKEQAKDVVENKETLSHTSSGFLEQNSNCSDCASVAIIASTSHYLNGNKEQAGRWAEKAYTLGNNEVEFLPTSQTVSTDQSRTKQQQLARAKDFIIGKRNHGTENFKKGNIQLIGLAQYKKAVPFYRTALRQGLQDNNSRKECYINLAVCLYHSRNEYEAKEVLRHAWLIHPSMQINVGEQATRDALQRFILEFQQM